MRFDWLKSLLTLVVLCLSLQVSAQNITMGGEIPWPLAHQYRVTAENSQGLWKLEQVSGTKYFNVEILDQVEGVTFMRVSELNPKTFEVISWGEGFFKDPAEAVSGTEFWSIYLDGNAPGFSDVGRYIYMYPNGDISELPYMVRLVEVRSMVGISLGLSFYPIAGTSQEHILGSRIQETPLECQINEVEDGDEEDPLILNNLICDLPAEPDDENKAQQDKA